MAVRVGKTILLSGLQDKVERRLLLNIVVGQRTTILQLLAGENQALLVRRNPLLVLNLGLDALNRVTGIHVQCNRLTSKSLHKDLHGGDTKNTVV